ncbi:hypothetical protein GUJ93_ZPchr0001g33036 [Zizania palustris]|uniref:Uncharacterized protein n=1 Tax=Zizania palustris TaxID=103762 RepID=A0A8J5RY69_ZIZPA|nr:hypothetical protein GUJ93_ZPchr0001g33036 [Zizania palustris]
MLKAFYLLQMDRRQQRHETLTGRRGGGGGRRGGAMARRQGRFHVGGGGGDGGCYGSAAEVAVVDRADCTAQSCRSCVGVTLADCVALSCCPCAVVSLLGLAFVKVPFAVACRCARRLRRRQGRLRQKKRVRDLDSAAAAKRAVSGGHVEPLAVADTSKGEDADADADAVAAAAVSPGHDVAASDVEKVWLELYQVGHWGFGRLSVSSNPPPLRPAYVATAHSADCAAGEHGS